MSDLLKINVNDHTEKKGGLTYLSWAWAWAEVLKIDPQATWVAHQYGPQGNEQPCMWIGETAIVHTSVIIKGLRRECLLPVMDNRNNAVKQPDARKISDAIMRCMTKAIAMHGLGLYIYAGEDLPENKQGGSPTDGATDTLTTAQREYVSSVAATIGQKMGADNTWGAYEELVSAIERVKKGRGDVNMFEVSLYKALPAQTRAALDAMKADERARALIKANPMHATK